MTTAYDLVSYPSVVHQPTHPERLAVAARLAGLDPAPLETARVLEIGGGTCLGLIAFAAAYPDSDCHGFDLSASAIARGRQLAGAQCPNVSLVVEDILEAHCRYAPRSFDYVIAHGIYAWVPEEVRRALLELISHVLSATGVSFVSYNALPGGHIRKLLREMVLYEVEGIGDPQQRVRAAYAFLEFYARPQEGDEPLQTALRGHARHMASRSPAVLFHDELGEVFAPQSLTQMVRAAERVGLRHLTDAGQNRGFDGFLTLEAQDSPDPDETILRAAQARDYLGMTFFRATLLARSEAPKDRRLVPGRIDALWISAQLKRFENGEFGHGDDRFAIDDKSLAEALADLSRNWPTRRRIRDFVETNEQRYALLDIYRRWYVRFHLGPGPFVMSPGVRPAVGAWIRGMLERGEEEIVSLNHKTMRIDQLELRALLVTADGSRTLKQLSRQGHGMPPEQVAGALEAAAKRALLIA